MKIYAKKNSAVVFMLILAAFLCFCELSSAAVQKGEEELLVKTDDPKTKEIIKKIENAGLSLYPAQYYEAWEITRRDENE